MSNDGDSRSLLFLSCDLVGSTAFKQKQSSWQRAFLSFYREFPEAVKRSQVGPDGYKGDFSLWKAVGDELIFVTQVSSEEDVYRAVDTWVAAMRFYEEDTLQGEVSTVDLATKGGAFIATFPGPDSEASIPKRLDYEDSAVDSVELNRIALKDRDEEKFLFDFFGPSIDTGFRVISQCSQRHFTLSVEVAWAYSHYLDVLANGSSDRNHNVRYLGRTSLKGVWRGREYPVFAIDRECDDDVHSSLEALEVVSPSLSAVRKVCKACYDSPHWRTAIFLPQAVDGSFKVEPEPSSLVSTETSVKGIEQKAEDEHGSDLRDDPPLGPIRV